MITTGGLQILLTKGTDAITKVNYYIDGKKYTIDISDEITQNSNTTKSVLFSGIDGTITKTELTDDTGFIIDTRSVNIALTVSKDLYVSFSFNLAEV